MVQQTLHGPHWAGGLDKERNNEKEDTAVEEQEEISNDASIANILGIDMEDVEGESSDEGEWQEEEETEELDEEHQDDQEFKSGQKVKKTRVSSLSFKNKKFAAEADAANANMEFLEQVASGPLRHIIRDEDRLLPKGIFDDDDKQDEDDRQSEESVELDRDVHKGPRYVFRYPQVRSHLTRVWGRVMQIKLTDELYKKCLVYIPEHVMGHLEDPLKLTDFFMESFNFGMLYLSKV